MSLLTVAHCSLSIKVRPCTDQTALRMSSFQASNCFMSSAPNGVLCNCAHASLIFKSLSKTIGGWCSVIWNGLAASLLFAYVVFVSLLDMGCDTAKDNTLCGPS